ncbi:hypothetical protein LTS09_016724 [Friedmanniomyces endolithicus]|nr:hypothetical protein LTS09_016724 [Friedmanniomyces endolithicus]
MASAVIKPDPDELPPVANGLKRRQSEVESGEQESKRQRISPGKSSPPTATVKIEAEAEDGVNQESLGKQDTPAHEAKPTESIKPEPESYEPPEQPEIKEEKAEKEPPRRRSGVTDEKQRSKRLFGALLGNLNQPSDRTSKRRQEIEARKQAELQRQDEERNVDKLRRLEALTEHRRKVQKKVDGENMRIRHAQMLNSANSLQTSSEPKLYYRPWELRPDEEDRIEQQVKEAERLVEMEAAEVEGWPVKVAEPVDEVGCGSPTRTLTAPVDGQVEVKSTMEDPPNGITTVENDPKPTKDDELDTTRGAGPEGKQERGSDPPEQRVSDPAAEQANGEQLAVEVIDSQATVTMNGDTDEATVLDESTKVVEAKQEDDSGDHVVEGDEDTVMY